MASTTRKPTKDKLFNKRILSIPLEYIVVAICSIVLAFLLLSSIYRESPVFDELIHVPAGFSFLTNHDFRAEPFSPPFTRELVAFPMLFQQNVLNDKILLLPRLIVVFFTLCLGILVYIFAKKLYGVRPGLFALLLYVFEPEILAQGHYAMTDLISTFFFILTLFLYFLFRKRMTYKKLILFSLVAGLTLAAKFTNFIYLFFTLGLFLVLDKKKALFRTRYWRGKVITILIFISVTFFSLWSTYFFTFEPALGYRFDPQREALRLAKHNTIINFALNQPIPLGSYISTIKEDSRTNYTTDFVKESVFWGNYSKNGFYGFFLLPVFLIKTPLPLIIFFIFSLLYFRNKNRENLLLLIPLGVILASTLFTHVLLVLRYILSIYPLIIIYTSQIINIVQRKKYFSYILFVFTIWYMLGTLSVYPHYLSYFNELVGGSENGYKYLAEGNMDLGQGLIDLASYQQTQKINNLQLAYMGTALPTKYGIHYERIKDRSMSDQKKIVPMQLRGHTLAISVTCWYFCGYYTDQALKNRKPADLVGGSILIFR